MQAAKPRQLATLTSLRAVAAGLVFVHHLYPFTDGTLGRLWRHVGAQGVTGVSFFFVLSGFVLAYSARADDTPARFYRRRFARIGPSYLLLTLIALPIAVYVTGSATAVWQGLPSFTFLQSWVPTASIHYGANSVGWSLSDEAFFYALFPFIVVPIARLSARAQLLVVASAAGVLLVLEGVLQPSGDTTADWAVYVLPAVRLVEFMAGIACCHLLRSGRRAPLPLWSAALVAAGVYLVTGFLPTAWQTGGTMVIPYALLIWAAADSDLHAVRRGLLHRPVLVRLGQWSFAFYLVHNLIIEVLVRAVGTSRELILVALAGSLAAAWLLYTRVEHPLERRLRGVPGSATSRVGGAVVRPGRRRAAFYPERP